MAQWNSKEFDEYVEESASRLLAAIRRILRNDADAEDALQETYLAAWRAQDRFDGKSTMNTWVHRIAINTALNKLRKSDSVSMEIEPDLEGIAHQASGRQIDDLALREVVWGAIDQLPDDQRVVLVLRDVEQMSSEEVADRLGVTSTAVRQRLHRARKYVSEILSPELCGAEGMTCGGRLDLLLDMIDGMLDEDVREPVLTHVAICSTCQSYATGYRHTISLPAGTTERNVQVPARLIERIIHVIHNE
jgi:RNA polymerase sigma-70 factor, ECF subfamily